MCDLLLLPGIKEFNERTVNIVTIWVNNCSLKIYEKILREKCEIRSSFGPFFPAFGLNTERYSVYLTRKLPIWTVFTQWKTSNKRSEILWWSCWQTSMMELFHIKNSIIDLWKGLQCVSVSFAEFSTRLFLFLGRLVKRNRKKNIDLSLGVPKSKGKVQRNLGEK